MSVSRRSKKHCRAIAIPCATMQTRADRHATGRERAEDEEEARPTSSEMAGVGWKGVEEEEEGGGGVEAEEDAEGKEEEEEKAEEEETKEEEAEEEEEGEDEEEAEEEMEERNGTAH